MNELRDLAATLDALDNTLRVAGVETARGADHDAFYRWGHSLDYACIRLADICRGLANQVEHYGDDRILRDDEDADPYQRAALMTQLLRELAGRFGRAQLIAAAYHSAASHLAVEVDPNGTAQR